MTTKDCTSLENIVIVLNQKYIHQLYDTHYFNTVEKLRVKYMGQSNKKSIYLYVKKIDTVFLMCGHLVVCNKCSKITQCKSAITEIVQIYYE